MQQLKQELEKSRDREGTMHSQVTQLRRERDGLQAMWQAEREQQGKMQQAVQSALAHANEELAVRLRSSRTKP